MANVPSGFFAHPSKIGCTLCPVLNLNPNGSGFPWAPTPPGAANASMRAADHISQRKRFDMTILPRVPINKGAAGSIPAAPLRTPLSSSPPYCCCPVDELTAALRAASAALYSASLKSYQPIQEKPISSIVRPVPAPTQFFGSGLYRFVAELSYQLM